MYDVHLGYEEPLDVDTRVQDESRNESSHGWIHDHLQGNLYLAEQMKKIVR
jgi:hypothetical protein